MYKKIQENYYLVKFKILQEEYYTFWYSDDVDGFMLDTDEFIISSAILRRINIRKINCNLFLDYWNIFSDIAHSLNYQFLGDCRENETISHIYEKLFYGCNILVKEDEEHYRPKWSKKERRWIKKVMLNGFKILSKGLGTSWHLPGS